MSELQQCPLCGGNASETKPELRDEGRYWAATVSCDFCGAETFGHAHWRSDGEEAVRDAIKSWHTRPHLDDIRQQLTAAQAENEALRERVAELEVAILDAVQAMPGGQAKADLRDVYDAEIPTTAWLLRKQAEAVEAAVYELTPGHYGPPGDPSPEFNAACEMCAEFSGYAQRLRQQADEAERD